MFEPEGCLLNDPEDVVFKVQVNEWLIIKGIHIHPLPLIGYLEVQIWEGQGIQGTGYIL